MRYTEIDGERYEVGACRECPFREMGDGYNEHCTYPTVDHDPEYTLWIEGDGTSIQEGCPLREVKEHKPCPFCGSTSLSEAYVDDEGNALDEWAMEVANRQWESEGMPGFESWDEFVKFNACHFNIRCNNCSAIVGSMRDIENAWYKWDRRAEE